MAERAGAVDELKVKPKRIGTSSLDLSFVTWNINHGSRDDDTDLSDAEYSKIQDFFITELFVALPETFACLQEVGVRKEALESILEGKFLCEVEQRCAVVGPTCVGNYRVEFSSKYSFREFQLCGVEIKLIGQDESVVSEFVLISYHAPYEGKKHERAQNLIDFFGRICEFADLRNKAVIIGGDFSLSVDKWELNELESLRNRVRVAEKYDRSSRRAKEAITSTFVRVYPRSDLFECHCKCSLNRPVPIQFESDTEIVPASSCVHSTSFPLYSSFCYDPSVTPEIQLVWEGEVVHVIDCAIKLSPLCSSIYFNPNSSLHSLQLSWVWEGNVIRCTLDNLLCDFSIPGKVVFRPVSTLPMVWEWNDKFFIRYTLHCLSLSIRFTFHSALGTWQGMPWDHYRSFHCTICGIPLYHFFPLYLSICNSNFVPETQEGNCMWNRDTKAVLNTDPAQSLSVSLVWKADTVCCTSTLPPSSCSICEHPGYSIACFGPGLSLQLEWQSRVFSHTSIPLSGCLSLSVVTASNSVYCTLNYPSLRILLHHFFPFYLPIGFFNPNSVPGMRLRWAWEGEEVDCLPQEHPVQHVCWPIPYISCSEDDLMASLDSDPVWTVDDILGIMTHDPVLVKITFDL